jgi:hypothetical protein
MLYVTVDRAHRPRLNSRQGKHLNRRGYKARLHEIPSVKFQSEELLLKQCIQATPQYRAFVIMVPGPI